MLKITKMLKLSWPLVLLAVTMVSTTNALVIDSLSITASTTDLHRDWEGPNEAVNPPGTGTWPGLVGEYPNEEHEISHNCEGQFRNIGDDTPTTMWLKLDLGDNYTLETLRVWNGGFFRASYSENPPYIPDGSYRSGINQADMYYSSAVDDPGDDFNVNWTLIGTAGTQTFNPAPDLPGATSGTYGVTDEIALGNIDARWFAIQSNSTHGSTSFTSLAEVQFIASEGLVWDGGIGEWIDENWSGSQPVAADMDMIINAETDPDDAEIIIGPSNVTVNADFVDDNGTGPGTGDGPAASVFVGEVGDDTFGAKLTIASAVTLEVTGESTAGEFGTIAIDNEAVLKTDSAIIEPDGNLVAGVQGDKNGLLQSAGQLSLEEIVDDGSGDVVAGGADGIQIDWLPLEGGTPEEGQASMFGGTYTIAEYTGTALTTEGVTSNENANIGTGYIKSVDYDVDVNGDGSLWTIDVELQPQGLGDTDLDADVDGDDLATFGLAWAPSGTDKTWFDGDFDFDGDIDGDDLAALGLAWAPSGIDFPAGDLEVTAVPEPGSIIMLLIGAAGLLIYRKRR